MAAPGEQRGSWGRSEGRNNRGGRGQWYQHRYVSGSREAEQRGPWSIEEGSAFTSTFCPTHGPPPGYEEWGQQEQFVSRGGRSSRRGHRWNRPTNSSQLNPHAVEWRPLRQHPVPPQHQPGSWSREQRPASTDAGPVRAGGHSPHRCSAHSGSDQQAAEPMQIDGEELEYPSCVICCEDLTIAAVGKCNHKDMCALCSLRMRMCYNKQQCPLCKTELTEVVMTRWRPGGVPDWKDLQREMPRMWTNLTWMRDVFVDNRPAQGVAAPKRPLSTELEARTSRVCSVCDPNGNRLYPSHRSLMRHMENAHRKTLCKVCLQAMRTFPAEMEAFDKAGLREHMLEHPKCEYCDIAFFSNDELFEHLRTAHHFCSICQNAGRNVYFESIDSFDLHLTTDHFRCNEEDCRECYVAFATLQELEAHTQEVHLQPLRARGRRSRGQPIELVPPNSHLPRGPRGSSGAASWGRGGNPGRIGESGSREGLRMIDDDVGMPTPPLVAPQYPGFERRGSIELQPAPPPPGHETGFRMEHHAPMYLSRPPPFPALGEGASRPIHGPTRIAPEPSRLPPLVSLTRRCPCGRRSDHPVMPQGTDPGPLHCDSACERQLRRDQLASAFDIPDPARHRPVMDRSRVVEHSPQLLEYAWHNRAWIEDIERVLIGFLDSTQQRYAFPPMPSLQRKIVHETVASFGMVSQSLGVEPNRFVQLFKGSNPVIPRNLASKVVLGLSAEDLRKLVTEKQGFELHLTDVSSAADLHVVFDRWEGDFRVQGPDQNQRASILFSSERYLQEALNVFGGGVRGLFLINRRHHRPSSAGSGSRHGNAL